MIIQISPAVSWPRKQELAIMLGQESDDDMWFMSNFTRYIWHWIIKEVIMFEQNSEPTRVCDTLIQMLRWQYMYMNHPAYWVWNLFNVCYACVKHTYMIKFIIVFFFLLFLTRNSLFYIKYKIKDLLIKWRALNNIRSKDSG